MSKRRVKQQNISVIGLFTLPGRRKKMDDVFVYHECQSTRWSHSAKNKNKQTQSKTTFATCLLLSMFVRFFICLSYTFCLLVSLNCTKRAVFKPLISPAYSTNIVIVIFNKWLPLLSDLGHPFAAHGLPFLLFLRVFTWRPPVNEREWRNETLGVGLGLAYTVWLANRITDSALS